MGGVNFTRNRAWWHTAVWDEYGMRHMYVALFPTFAFMIPMYWYGTFVNRDLEQNYAAKMYQLDYENRRNRLTHNLIMEHFETHVEKIQDILDEVREHGFEKAFEYEISNPDDDYVREALPVIDEELYAEISEHYGVPQMYDNIMNQHDVPYWLREMMSRSILRRKTPFAPYKYLSQFSTFSPATPPITKIDTYEK
jgi:hypothetical protein